jgi:hypothetical protein
MSELATEFTNRRTQRAFEDQLKGHICAGEFNAAEQIVGEALTRYPSEFTALYEALPPEGLTLLGWPELQADFLDADELIEKRNRGRCEVVALDVVNRNHHERLFLQSAFYGWPAGVSLAARPAGFARSPQDSFDKHDWRHRPARVGSLDVQGLDELVEAQRKSEFSACDSFYGERAPNHYVGAIVANWLILLRINQAIVGNLASLGLPRSVPVLCGVDQVDWPMETNTIDYGRSLECVYAAKEWRDGTSAVAEIRIERQAKSKAEIEAETDSLIAELVEKRSILQHWPRWWRPGHRREAADIAETKDRLWYRAMQLEPGVPTWRMAGHEFTEFVGKLIHWRHPDGRKLKVARVDPAARSELHEMFVKYGINFGGRWVRMNVAYDRQLLCDGQHPLQTGKPVN